ncbi:nuclear transport factor 2 family protein (plasmid) [Sinorhizobium chiapasense]|uniref:nuclear transport factor 2 family protein n=1 Tax=Sinorhizobium chiapasense TaxID=501572 RepID=UPI002FE42170
MTHNAADRQLIMEVVARYAFGYDEAEFDLIGEAFTTGATSKGVWSTGSVAWGPMRGREEIVSVLSAMRKGQLDQPRHIITNFHFTKQTDSSASARFYLALNSTVGDKCSIVSAGKYDAEFVKDAGIWRLSRLDALLDRSY